ncbi:thiamine-phosphate diphosphorylase [Andreprevotia lacus DSM 23236]|jgi:thiamine-phosphate pyrophosphorylase|uniref:Thiamine-phosphate synthase n=1 Tax=Andreprevotia lacus DSM 23236 TaxID=1121001 RepID=A0A1W1XVR2_9NEIS|nr:thiamine phosphate synthase [Andreprevotia lacus]SMC27942.1 thiamine-phosphate diphosphorylase [Andreprevotia lacus DSM 23236]
MSAAPRITRAQLGLYLVTDEAACNGRDLLDVVAEAVAGGVRCVQLREKHLGTTAFLARARAMKALLAPLGIPFIINDSIDIAMAVQADGVHVGQHDAHVTDIRHIWPDAIIGLSVENPAQLQAATALDVDYLGISPLFATATKPDAAPPWGLDGLRHIRAQTTLPLVAIGGIDTDNAADVLAAGADGLAVVSAICSAPSPRAAAAALAASLSGITA